MTEALSLFRHIVREKAFARASVILFLNKTDLLADKITTTNVKDYFPAFAGLICLRMLSYILCLLLLINCVACLLILPHVPYSVHGKCFNFNCFLIHLLTKLSYLYVLLHFEITSQLTGDPRNLEHVQQFFLSEFVKERTDTYSHFTCATDTGNIRHVFESVEATLMRKHMDAYHLL